MLIGTERQGIIYGICVHLERRSHFLPIKEARSKPRDIDLNWGKWVRLYWGQKISNVSNFSEFPKTIKLIKFYSFIPFRLSWIEVLGKQSLYYLRVTHFTVVPLPIKRDFYYQPYLVYIFSGYSPKRRQRSKSTCSLNNKHSLKRLEQRMFSDRLRISQQEVLSMMRRHTENIRLFELI